MDVRPPSGGFRGEKHDIGGYWPGYLSGQSPIWRFRSQLRAVGCRAVVSEDRIRIKAAWVYTSDKVDWAERPGSGTCMTV